MRSTFHFTYYHMEITLTARACLTLVDVSGARREFLVSTNQDTFFFIGEKIFRPTGAMTTYSQVTHDNQI